MARRSRRNYAEDLRRAQSGGLTGQVETLQAQAALGSTSSAAVYNDSTSTWPARPSVVGPVTWYGPLALAGTPSGIVNGDVVVDTAAVINASGSFQKSIGVCRTYDDPSVLVTARAQTVGRTVFMRLRGALAGSTGAAIGVTTASGNIALGLYSNSGTAESAVPGPQKATTGVVACPAAGFVKVPWTGSATDAAEGDWLGFVADDATTAKFLGNATLFPQTAAANALALAQNGTGAVLPATPAGTFASAAIFAAKIL